jgi:regulator of replication initiation timing
MSSAIEALAQQNRDLRKQLAEITIQFVNLRVEMDQLKSTLQVSCRNITLFSERIEVALEGK